MTKEDRAGIARGNGAKSKGPITGQGKAASSRNAIKSGQHATKLELFVPPHSAVLCNEERRDYARLVESLLGVYRPVNEAALSIVKGIAIAHWEIARLRTCITMTWDLALVEHVRILSPIAPEIIRKEAMVRASTELYANNGPVRNLNRQIDQLELRIARFERRLKFLNANFPNDGENPLPIENTSESTVNDAELSKNEPPVYVTEDTPAVIASYKKQFPNREIVVLPADDEDGVPTAPRRAA